MGRDQKNAFYQVKEGNAKIMNFILPIICFIVNGLVAEIYPLAQKPFLEELDIDGFARGTFLIIVASSDLEDILSTDSEKYRKFYTFQTNSRI